MVVVKVTFKGRLIVYSSGVCRGTANRYDCSEAIPHDGRRGRQGTVGTVWSVRWHLREVGVSSEYLFSDRLSKVNEGLVYRGLLCDETQISAMRTDSVSAGAYQSRQKADPLGTYELPSYSLAGSGLMRPRERYQYNAQTERGFKCGACKTTEEEKEQPQCPLKYEPLL